MRARTILAPFLAPLLAFTLGAAAPRLQRQVLAMGTRLSLDVEGRNLDAASEAGVQEVARIEAACSTWRPDSGFSRLNAAQDWMPLDAEWLQLLGTAKAWSGRMEGAFDPALGRLVQAWGARQGGRVPAEDELAAARAASGAGLLELDPAGGRARLRGGAWVEEGGFVKGYALDRMRAQLQAQGAESGLLDFGGQLLAWGRPRRVSVADPARRGKARISLVLADASLACSSDAVRGKHLLDPRTGRPCPAWGEAAAVAPTGLVADILSKAYVMGPEAGLAWADAQGCAVAFLPLHGPLRLSRAFKALHPTLLR